MVLGEGEVKSNKADYIFLLVHVDPFPQPSISILMIKSTG